MSKDTIAPDVHKDNGIIWHELTSEERLVIQCPSGNGYTWTVTHVRLAADGLHVAVDRSYADPGCFLACDLGSLLPPGWEAQHVERLTETSKVSILYYSPGELTDGSPPYGFRKDARRRIVAGTFETLAKLLRSKCIEGNPKLDPNVAKRANGAWVPGLYQPGMGHGDLAKQLISTRLLVLDGDSADPHKVATALAPYAKIIHTTYKHTPSNPRCRVVLLLAQDCTSGDDYNIGLREIAGQLTGQGFTFPVADSKLGKLAFMPMHLPGVEPILIHTPGRMLDLERIVRAHKANAKKAETKTPAKKPATPGEHGGALVHAASQIREASPGTIHNTRYAAAIWLKNDVGADDDAIRQACLDAGADAKAIRCVEDAIRKGDRE